MKKRKEQHSKHMYWFVELPDHPHQCALVRANHSTKVIIASNFNLDLEHYLPRGVPNDQAYPLARFTFIGRDACDPTITDLIKYVKDKGKAKPSERLERYRQRRLLISNYQSLSDKQLGAMARMKRDGLSQRRIAAHFGVSRAFVQRHKITLDPQR